MRVDEYLKSLSFLDKPSPWMTSWEKSNRGEQNEEKEVTQRGARSANAQGGSEFRCRLRQTDLQAVGAAALSPTFICFNVKRGSLDRAERLWFTIDRRSTSVIYRVLNSANLPFLG